MRLSAAILEDLEGLFGTEIGGFFKHGDLQRVQTEANEARGNTHQTRIDVIGCC
jgi:hypothetical protein